MAFASTGKRTRESPIRLITFNSLRDRQSAGYPRFPEDEALCVSLEDIDRSSAFIVFVSHGWLRGWDGAEGWDGRPHPDNAQHGKFALTVEGVEKAWRSMAPGMTKCYLWLDFACIDQDGDPCGELEQLDKIVQACDCIFTPIVDHDWGRWGNDLTSHDDWFDDYRAPLWLDGEYAYLNRAWCRMEMLYAANLDLLEDIGERIDNFAAGLRLAAECNFRPHLLYGTRESKTPGGGRQPIMLPPLQNSFVDSHSPRAGSITKKSDWPKIEQLTAALKIRRVVEGYVGERNESGVRHGHGKMTKVNGEVYEGQWQNDLRHGKGNWRFADWDVYNGDFRENRMHGPGVYKWANGNVYDGLWENGLKHGHGVMRWANGNVFDGQWEDGKMHGQGFYMFANGNKFEGRYQNDKKHGKGIYTFDNGAVYDGQFVDGKRHGFGVFTDADGEVYEGGFEDNKEHGVGRLLSSSGEVLVEGRWEGGEFVEDLQSV